MAPPILLLQDIALTFGGAPLLAGAELSVGPGERLCLVGRNGSGKSTLLKIAAGLIEPDGGKRFVQPGMRINYLPQEPDLSGFATTAAFVEAGLGAGDGAHRARHLLETLGLTGDEDTARLSGGELRRASLARTLAPDPDILLLDEPTNHLDVIAIESLEETLKESRAAIVLVSHDRRFLETLSSATVWLDRGTTRRLEQGFAAFEGWRDQVLEDEEREGHKLERKIVREEDWLRYGVTARRKRNERRLRALQELRRERQRTLRDRPVGDATLTVQEAAQSGKLVIEAERIAKSYGERPIVRNFSLRVQRGDRIGIVGPNGAGKTTLLNLLTGVLPPDAGAVRLGTNLTVASLDQQRSSLDPDATVADTLTGGRGDTVVINGETRHVVGYMKDFLFRPEQARSPVSALSGGERGRLLLASALARPSNLLVLDEPTNDLDLETLDLLQEMLAGYPGTLLLVSHDRDFLDRVATSVITFEGNGRWIEYAGGYSDMLAQRGAAIEAKPAVRPASPRPAPAGNAERQPRRRLSFAERQVLATSPGRIEALTDEIRRLEVALSDPNFYGRDPAGFTTAGRALETARSTLAAAEEEWLRVELLREEIERA
ncbi:MAG TPA: ATP-binding cassette domain-containing protein [Methylomirabilota bacterium]|nr:ATP-binding cassette domain-containing protein [Methylomirabilota bacterium]